MRKEEKRERTGTKGEQTKYNELFPLCLNGMGKSRKRPQENYTKYKQILLRTYRKRHWDKNCLNT